MGLQWDNQPRATLSRNRPARCNVAPCEGSSRHSEATTMDWNRIQGNWKQAQGQIKEKWGKLTDDDLATINGQREQLEGILQKRYGVAKDMAREDIDTWLKSQP
jgi:uncharacterized protein YjbJ (UPF0337 family)